MALEETSAALPVTAEETTQVEAEVGTSLHSFYGPVSDKKMKTRSMIMMTMGIQHWERYVRKRHLLKISNSSVSALEFHCELNDINWIEYLEISD